MERRLMAALLLSMGVLYLWNVVINPPPPPPPKSEQQEQAEKEQKSPTKAPHLDENINDINIGDIFGEDSTAPIDSGKMLPKVGEKPEALPLAKDKNTQDTIDDSGKQNDAANIEAQKLAAKENVAHDNVQKLAVEEKPAEVFKTIETDLFKAIFTSYGAKLFSFELKQEKYSHDTGEGQPRRRDNIVKNQQNKYLPFALLMDQANFSYKPDQPYEVVSVTNSEITFKTETPQGVSITKQFEFIKDYLFKINIIVDNNAAGNASFFPKIGLVGMQNGAKLSSGLFGSAPMNQQIPKAFLDGELWDETSKDALLTPVIKKGQIIWTAIDDRYFLLSLLPPEDVRSQITVKSYDLPVTNIGSEEYKNNLLTITHMLEKYNVLPGATQTITYHAYIGPKEYSVLQDAGSHLEDAIDFWVLGFLARPMLTIMKYSYSVFPNWGIAIIILTIIIKLLLYPLTRKSFESMQKMKDLKPMIDKLKEKTGDDKQEFNTQMMNLYKKEGVNPLGGCLPMLLQMPVYIALYKMLQNAVELYNSPFIPGWLNDLVQPDPYYILPVALGGLMFVQQKMTPTPDSQQQKMMMYMMPAMMFFFMLMLPSGLVLYIASNTLVTIGQQWWIAKKANEKKQIALKKKTADLAAQGIVDAEFEEIDTSEYEADGVFPDKLLFIKEERKKQFGRSVIYKIYKAPDEATAMKFLKDNPVDKELLYFVVESPEGKITADLDGIHKEDEK